MKNLNGYLQKAWQEMGLPGRPTFTDVRTAVSAHGKNLHPADVRKKMATYMCHDEQTADKFYALSLSRAQSREMRNRFEATLLTGHDTEEEDESTPGTSKASAKPAKSKAKRKLSPPRDSSEEDDPKVPFQESGESDLETVVFSDGDLSSTQSPESPIAASASPLLRLDASPVQQRPAAGPAASNSPVHWDELEADMAHVSAKHPLPSNLLNLFFNAICLMHLLLLLSSFSPPGRRKRYLL